MNYSDLLLTIYAPQKYAIMKMRSTDELLAYAKEQNLNFTEEQAEKLILMIKKHNKELTDEEMKTIADKSRITTEAPCRYCGSRTMELSMDRISFYLTCSACKCNIIEV